MKADPGLVSYYLGDLLDFVRGIQHPMRGLFLRSFLNTSVRGLLPDTSGMQNVSTIGSTITDDLPLLSTCACLWSSATAVDASTVHC